MSRRSLPVRAVVAFVLLVGVAAGAGAACDGSKSGGAGGGGGTGTTGSTTGTSSTGSTASGSCMGSGNMACPVPCDETKHPGATQGEPCATDGETCVSHEPSCGQSCTVTCVNGIWGQADCTMIPPTC